MPDQDNNIEAQDLVTDCLAADGLVVYLAEDILALADSIACSTCDCVTP